MEEKVGLKETLEIIAAAEGLIVDSLKAAEDGIDFDDMNVLFKNLQPLKDAVEGADKVAGEFKDLDLDEIKQLVERATALAFNIAKAAKALSDAKKAE